MSEVKKYRGYTIKITADDFAENPRTGFDNLGTMVCFHGRLSLGDTGHGYNSQDFSGWEGLKKEILNNCPGAVILPLYLYSHSGETIRTTPFSCKWDSGQVGFIFMSLYDARKEYGWKVITQKRRAQLEGYLRGEVETYDTYLRGEVYGFEVIDPAGNELDSCWGYYGAPESSGLMQEARSRIDYSIKEVRKEHFKKVKQWISSKVELMHRKPMPTLGVL
jgi:hypothetical protein